MKLKLAYKLTRKDIISVTAMSLVVVLLFLVEGVDFKPGVTKDCDGCKTDLGQLNRVGHFEEMLWNGVRHVHDGGII